MGHEDKTYPCDLIASLSIPWGEAKGDEDLGVYHLVWTRDMVLVEKPCHNLLRLFSDPITTALLLGLKPCSAEAVEGSDCWYPRRWTKAGRWGRSHI
jgi:hypothetical protein